MPAPRQSYSVEAARAAALQAEFNEKKWVWVPDEKEGYLAGWVNKEEGDLGEIVMASGGEIRTVPLYALSKMNPPKFDRVEDIADLTFLNEASVVHNLRLRYGSGNIYTYSGLFLVAINPYQNLPLYTDAIIQQYRHKRRDENPPHIFAVAERAWINMGEERENQSILITGESGAGKTESTKKVIQYLAAIATDAQLPASPSHSRSPTITPSFSGTIPTTGLPRTGSFRRGHVASPSLAVSSGSQLKSKGRLGLLERQILQANPILEAFGNAQTQRNNNSSRFGKFIRISFAPDGSIAGANIDWYLLEKSRVVIRSEAERSFHVFYQLLSGGGALRNTLLLTGNVEDYEYLNKSRREVDGVDDRQEWNALKAALDVVGFTPSEQLDLFRIVAAVLHIGNIAITSSRSDDALLPDPSQAERVCHLLGVPVQDFIRAVLSPRVLAGREWVTQARTHHQALAELASLCKTLYEKSFSALVDKINLALDRPSSKSSFIGVLDIAGFEIFDVNGYEQLLINYTNEKLQQFFNHHMFVLEQEEYAREGIQWEYVNFGLDLQPTIELIENTSAPHIGILACLDEECIMPKATDLTFTNKLRSTWHGAGQRTEHDSAFHRGGDKYEPTRFEQGFIVQHYAGKVEYRTDGWLEKNKDPLNDNLTRVLAASTEGYVASLFSDYADQSALGTALTLGKKRALTKKGAFRTVGQRHKEQLSSLMAQLHATQPHFVRCLVPNPNKKPGRIDVPLVLDQLRCNGVLEGIRIARLGYPNRLPFIEFRQRYEILTPGIIPRGYMDGRKAAVKMVTALELDEAIFKVGTSKIFFKAGVLAELEERRDALLYDLFSRFQSSARMWTARRQVRKILNRATAIRTVQRNARVYGVLRDWPWWQLYTKVRPLLAATRNDEELRRKELELALAQERAEREKQEREAFEKLKIGLEKEKRKIEEDLSAERAFGLEKDELIIRSKAVEEELREEIEALHKDIDELDSQLDRAMKIQKEGEDKHLSLKDAFNEAAKHLVTLEAEQKEREVELGEQIVAIQSDLEQAVADRDELERLSEEFKQLAMQREDDLARAKERLDVGMRELETKLAVEQRDRDSYKERVDSLSDEARHAKEQLAELTRTATEYSNMLRSKEDTIGEIKNQLDVAKLENEALRKEIIDLQSDLDVLASAADDHDKEQKRTAAYHKKLQDELDELRALLEAKTTEVTRQTESEKSREVELADLRQQVSRLQQELGDARKSSLEMQGKLKAELENSQRSLENLDSSHKSLLERDHKIEKDLAAALDSVADLEKTKRSLQSDLQALRTKQIESESELAEATKAKESAQRQLQLAQTKNQESEDVLLQLERDKANSVRQLETNRKQTEEHAQKYTQLERAYNKQKQELNVLKERNTKFDQELNKALDDIKAREWEVKQLESRQDKTIVEHVHVLQEAKRRTDKELEEAHAELQRNSAYIRSLEKAKTRLTTEAEDMQRQTERERVQIRSQEKAVKAQESRLATAAAEIDSHRHAKDVAELAAHRLELQLQETTSRLQEVSDNFAALHRSKETLEAELNRLADETSGSDSLARMQREYESRISQLEQQLQDADITSEVADRVKANMDRHHAEIRDLINKNGPPNDGFQSRILQALQLADEALLRDLSTRSQQRQSAIGTSPKKSSRRHSTPQKPSSPQPQNTANREVAVLKQHVQVLEVQLAASDRVRSHLENSIREMSAELEHSDGSKQALQQHRAKLAQENARLAVLLQEETEARRATEANQVDGIQSMWIKFEHTIHQERESYRRLEESKKALVVQQRTNLEELERVRANVRELSQSKKQAEIDTRNLKEQLASLRKENNDQKQRLQQRSKDNEVSISSSSAAQSELRAALEAYVAKEATYKEQLEAASLAATRATRAEQQAQRSLMDLQKRFSESEAARQRADETRKSAEREIKTLHKRFEEGNRSASNSENIQQRLLEELEDVRSNHQKDIADRDFTNDQTRKKYQAELSQLSEDLQAQREGLSHVREENRKLRSDYDELQLRYDDEVYNSRGWKKEKERLETRIADLTKVYESNAGAASEQQDQIVSLHSQVRELRSVLNDAEADRALLQKARRALQAELETIKLDSVDPNKMTSDRELQRLNLKKLDLERSLEEKEDRVKISFERMKKAEAHASECQAAVDRVRVENSELDRLNAHLEKQVKDLKVHIVDLETKSWARSPRSSTGTPSRRIEELTSQLTQASESSKAHTTGSKAGRQQVELDRQRAKLEEERRGYESRMEDLRRDIDTIQSRETDLQTAKRRAEREAAESRQKALNLEREVERLRNRLGSPASSPRK